MKNAFKELHQWAKENPVKACVFSALTGILATWDGTRAHLTSLDLIPWAVLIILAAWGFSITKLVSMLLALCLLLPSESKAAEKPQSGLVIAGVVVIVVGGVVIFKVVQFCQNHFPRQDPPPTNNVPNLESTDFYAGSMTYSALGNCYSNPNSSSLLAVVDPATVFEFSGGFDGEFNFRMTECRKVPSATDSVDLQEFESELVPWGIRLGGGGESFFGLNGRPCPPGDVPVSFGTGPVVDVAVGDWVQTVVFEKSEDLVNWEAMLTMTISAEQRVRFSDAGTSSQVFYRCRPL